MSSCQFPDKVCIVSTIVQTQIHACVWVHVVELNIYNDEQCVDCLVKKSTLSRIKNLIYTHVLSGIIYYKTSHKYYASDHGLFYFNEYIIWAVLNITISSSSVHVSTITVHHVYTYKRKVTMYIRTIMLATKNLHATRTYIRPLSWSRRINERMRIP